jgi:hypothetical protein
MLSGYPLQFLIATEEKEKNTQHEIIPGPGGSETAGSRAVLKEKPPTVLYRKENRQQPCCTERNMRDRQTDRLTHNMVYRPGLSPLGGPDKKYLFWKRSVCCFKKDIFAWAPFSFIIISIQLSRFK